MVASPCYARQHVHSKTASAVVEVDNNVTIAVGPAVIDIEKHERRKEDRRKRVKGPPKKLVEKSAPVNVADAFADTIDCSFADPVIEHAKQLLGLFDSFKAAVDYAELTNVPFRRALGQWFSKNITMEGLFDEGFALGEVHRLWFNETVPSEKRDEVICQMESALYLQLNTTCHYNEWKEDLITVSIALMEGYAHAVDHASFAGCHG